MIKDLRRELQRRTVYNDNFFELCLSNIEICTFQVGQRRRVRVREINVVSNVESLETRIDTTLVSKEDLYLLGNRRVTRGCALILLSFLR